MEPAALSQISKNPRTPSTSKSVQEAAPRSEIPDPEPTGEYQERPKHACTESIADDGDIEIMDVKAKPWPEGTS